MNASQTFLRWFSAVGRAFRHEIRTIFHDPGVILFFFVLPLAYPVVYTLIYNPEVVRELPVAVVDNSRTPESRLLVREAAASPAIAIYDYCPNMADAKELMAQGKVFGILEIPSDYARNIGRGEQANVSFFADMSLLLRYRTFVGALTDVQLKVIGDITATRIAEMGAQSLAGDSRMPVNSESNFLGDSEQGFASFVIPGIVILILQQSMLLGICLIGGTAAERRRANGGADLSVPAGMPSSAIAWGRTLAYVVCYIPTTVYVTRFIPEIFNLPHYGNPADYLLFLFPQLLASAFLGQTLNLFMKERESAFVLIVFTSVCFLFLSGLTWPRYAMNGFWTTVGNFIPATWGVEGFIRINSNAASLAESARPYSALWILSAIYMVLAILVVKYHNIKNKVTSDGRNQIAC